MNRLEELRENGGRVDRSSAALIALSGTDVRDFLQRMVTADVAELGIGDGAPTFLLERTGRVVDRVVVVVREADVWLVGNDGRGEAVTGWVEKYVIADDVTVRDEAIGAIHWILFGAAGKEALVREFGAEAVPDHAWQSRAIEWKGSSVTVLRGDNVAGGSWHVIAPSALESDLESWLEDVPLASADEWADLCLVAGVPRFGAEYDDRTIPLETGMMREISFTKGCFLGQEVIARLHNFKRVKRALVRLRLDSDHPPSSGELFRGGKKIGEVTGVVACDGAALAFGYVPREVAAAPTPLMLRQNEAEVEATILGGVE